MNDSLWHDLVAEFRALGGIAENICLREGAHGRGLFPVNPARPVAIRIPDHLLADSAWAEFHDGSFRLAQGAQIGGRERAFLEEYQNGLSWRRPPAPRANCRTGTTAHTGIAAGAGTRVPLRSVVCRCFGPSDRGIVRWLASDSLQGPHGFHAVHRTGQSRSRPRHFHP